MKKPLGLETARVPLQNRIAVLREEPMAATPGL